MKRKVIAALLCAGMMCANIGSVSSVYAASGAMINAEVNKQAQAVALEIAEEGMVLIKNDNNVLPLNGKKVNVFGASSVNPILGGGGSGSINTEGGYISLYESLENAGIEYNTELKEAYENWSASSQIDTSVGGGAYIHTATDDGSVSSSSALNSEWDIMNDVCDEEGNVVEAKMEEAILQRAQEYSDTAIVVLGRCGSEDGDLSFEDLTLRESEAAMLEYVSKNYEHTIVLFNTCNIMEMGWLESGSYGEFSFDSVTYKMGDEEHTCTYDTAHEYAIQEIDAALCIWAPGEVGMEAVGEILTGEINPSGKLADTVPYDTQSAPASLNYGQTVYPDSIGTFMGNGHGRSNGILCSFYVECEEGIYVGYKYYETFAKEEVQYPFGYGLSYTTFEWESSDLVFGTNEYGEKTISVDVTVTNTGDCAGKDVVQLYYSQPFYNDTSELYNIQKSDVNLGAYAKTKLLQPGESETVTLTFDVRDMASYSTEKEGYLLECGTYEISISDNARTATEPGEKSTVLTWEVDETSLDETYATYLDEEHGAYLYFADELTGTEYENAFDEDTYMYAVDEEGNQFVSTVYMERYDEDGVPTVKEGTYPTAADNTLKLDLEHYGFTSYADSWANPDLGEEDLADAPQQCVVYYDEEGNVDTFTIQDVYKVLYDEENTYGLYHDVDSLNSMLGTDFQEWSDELEEEVWDLFVDQFSVYDLIYMALNSGIGGELTQYGMVGGNGEDGPVAIGTSEGKGCAFAMPTCTATTWNIDLAYAMGAATGDEAVYGGTELWWGPGLNIHRNAGGGRNFEYYSEDPLLTGQTAAYVIKGAQEHGLICCMKHFAANDQETGRRSIMTFCREQYLREVALNAFEETVKVGGANSVMTSYNCIGTMWAGGHEGMINQILRDEWGADGYLVTDAYEGGYMDVVNMVLAGADSTLTTKGFESDEAEHLRSYYYQYPVTMGNALREVAKHACLTQIRSSAFDPEYVSTKVTNTGYRATLVLDSAEAESGASIAVPITIEDNKGLKSLELLVYCDTEALELQNVTAGEVLEGLGNFNFAPFSEKGEVVGYQIYWEGESAFQISGELMTLELKANEAAASGIYEMELDYTDENTLNYRDEEFNFRTYRTSGGWGTQTLTVEEGVLAQAEITVK
ncbi:MAG: glycoside hydrolase family 3 C-terminal domain-containing protein [Lachnospiraceae bacterium]|nr:glycoside hydrolase family 3 C-terminal domain-containing protein [Robinsoniella sp.]MDY3767588.1 glycoside hydrolase family 3 C-terminal domain-containing protein [Lachnospiraceae bacterium]